MRQNYMEYGGKMYNQGTVFVFKKGGREERMTFLFFDSSYCAYSFLAQHTNGSTYRMTYRSINFMDNFLRVEQPTIREIQLFQSEMKQINTKPRKEMSDLDFFLILLLMLALMAVFPPIALVYLFIAFAYKKK